MSLFHPNFAIKATGNTFIPKLVVCVQMSALLLLSDKIDLQGFKASTFECCTLSHYLFLSSSCRCINEAIIFPFGNVIILLFVSLILMQSENAYSLSGVVPLTELYFDSNSLLLVSGDQSGMVRLIQL